MWEGQKPLLPSMNCPTPRTAANRALVSVEALRNQCVSDMRLRGEQLVNCVREGGSEAIHDDANDSSVTQTGLSLSLPLKKP